MKLLQAILTSGGDRPHNDSPEIRELLLEPLKKTHDPHTWQSYVPYHLVELWDKLDIVTKAAIYTTAKEAYSNNSGLDE